MCANNKAGGLRDAVMAGELPAVNKLLDAGVAPNSPRARLADWTPLHYAAQLGHTEIIDALLDHGAEPQPRDKDGQTPLMQTGYWGRAEAKELLLRRGGGEESEVPPKMIMEEQLKYIIQSKKKLNLQNYVLVNAHHILFMQELI